MWIAGFKWMFLIIGTAIGAGYASGREIWQFFGYESELALIIFMLLFIVCCSVLLHISYTFRTSDYVPLLQIIVGKRLSVMYDVMIFLYLFTISIVMIAGSGVTGQAFQLSYWWGVALIVMLLILTFMRGINGVVVINQFVSPFLIIGLLYALGQFIFDFNVPLVSDWKAQSNWLAAFPFVALNILPLIAVLGAIGHKVKSKGEIYVASISSGLVLGVVSFMYNSSLVQIADEVLVYEMPLFAILQHYPMNLFIFMSIMLWLAIFTAAACSILGLITRLQARIPLKMWIIATLLIACMIPLTLFGFSTLVSVTYPIYGFLNLYVLIRLIYYPFAKRTPHKPVK